MEESPSKQDPLAQALEEALASEQVPNIYANGFINAISQADITILLQRNNAPVAVLNMSFTMAKSFAEKLSATIADFERTTKHPILTIEAVHNAQAASVEEKP
jgi:hypothetical protein